MSVGDIRRGGKIAKTVSRTEREITSRIKIENNKWEDRRRYLCQKNTAVSRQLLATVVVAVLGAPEYNYKMVTPVCFITL